MGPMWFLVHNLTTTCQIFTNKLSFYSKIYDQHVAFFIYEILVAHGDWYLVCTFGVNMIFQEIFPKWFFRHNLATTCQIFTKNLSFYSKFYDKQLQKLFSIKFCLTWEQFCRFRTNGGPKKVFSWYLGNYLLGFHKQCLILNVCSYHVTYAFQSESTLYSCLNVKEVLARSRCQTDQMVECSFTN